MAVRRAAALLERSQPNGELPETFWYTAKRRLLGPPIINAELRDQRLSKKLALGVLSPDGISSSAYGTEEILIELVKVFGMAAFTLLLPMTGSAASCGKADTMAAAPAATCTATVTV